MKKILLAVCALFMFSAVFAQSERVDMRKHAVAVPYKGKTQLTGFEQGAEPQVQPSRYVGRNFIGSTFYDVQSNGSMAQRMVAHNDGTLSAIWTTCGSTAATRGTGYNYYNGSYWENPSSNTSRIENTKTGWGTIASIGNAEIVISHNGTSALVISICPQKGAQEWTHSTLQGPSIHGFNNQGQEGNTTALLWPAIATSGNTIHLIACTDSDTGFYYQGINTCLLYYRGTFDPANNTISWESPRIVGDVNATEVSKFQGDGYAIAAKGNNVAIVALPGTRADGFLWKSTDNGVNFTKTVFLESAIKDDLAAMVDTNLYVNDGSCAVAIGDDGRTHVALGTYLVVADSANASSYYWYPGIGYLLYWNDSQAPIMYNNNDTYMQPDVLTAAGYTVVERFNLDCDESLWGLSSWGASNFPSYGTGSVSFPQLVAENGKVYMTFCQILEFPFIDVTNEKYYRGVFATKSTDNGQTFGDYSWLSYNKDCTYMTSWELFPMDSSVTYNDVAEYIYNEGESVFPAVAPNLVNGRIAMCWQQDYNAGSYIKETENAAICQEESSIIYFVMDADSIGIFNNTNEVCQGLWVDNVSSVGVSNKSISGIKMYPNPASESVNIAFTSEEADNAAITVRNLMGQEVYTLTYGVNEGNNLVNIPVKDLANGIYMVTVQTSKGISTQKLVVK